jgi:hypothetical protein
LTICVNLNCICKPQLRGIAQCGVGLLDFEIARAACRKICVAHCLERRTNGESQLPCIARSNDSNRHIAWNFMRFNQRRGERQCA